MSSQKEDYMARLTGSMHHARLDSSPRLKKLLAVLSDGQWHSTADLSHRCHNYAVGTSISELRANGKRIESKMVRADISKERWFEYRLEVAPVRFNPCQGCESYYTMDRATKVCAVEQAGGCALVQPFETIQGSPSA
jgi:hypothetical protein